MLLAHLREQILGTLRGPPLRTVVRQFFQYGFKTRVHARRGRKCSGVPMNLGMRVNVTDQCLWPSTTLCNESVGALLPERANDEKSLSALWHEVHSIKDKRIHRIAEGVECFQSLSEVASCVGCQKPRYILHQHERRFVTHLLKNFDEAPKCRGLLSLQSCSCPCER